jgi:hypothetical protein
MLGVQVYALATLEELVAGFEFSPVPYRWWYLGTGLELWQCHLMWQCTGQVRALGLVAWWHYVRCQ